MNARRITLIASALGACACARPAPPVTGAIPASVAPVDRPAMASSAGPESPAIAPLQEFVDSMVALPQFINAHWGILLVAPDRRDPLAHVNADKLVMPASNQKLVTGAVALALLGPEYTWRTVFTRTGPIVNGVLRGNLLVSGGGDPTVSVAMRGDPLTAFGPLIDALRSAGVTRIDGTVRSNEAPAFPGSPLGFGWDWDDLDADYGAGVTELMFNDAFTDVLVTGCRPAGKPACVTTGPLAAFPIIRSTVTTRTAGSGAAMLQWWRDSAAVPGISVRGSIAAGDSTSFTVSQPDTRATYIAAVTQALAQSAITVRGRAIRTSGSDTVAVLTSMPLRQVLPAMQKPSQNQIAEVVFRTVALQQTGVGTPDSARVVVERQLAAWGVRPDAYAIRDGSGLSRHDYLTPRAIVRVLDEMRRHNVFATFRDALPVAGVDGTLEKRMRGFAAGRVQAKTGTIDKARSLSGYVTNADGELLIFSIIANNFTVPNREVDRVAEAIVEKLVMMRRAAP
ncbi:MAG: D-alanyl-D-alanine carboxypeptidase/D-alanyl-D-alanine-endopeptidase [Gemmatimonadaceae bacterium]|nr:D-alanyl-D-alanine carboxypeptidase/D-alanyl-D-alanine-endopeptidase [Gemmatimonadaceae bacterium]